MKNEKENQSLNVPYASRQDMILYAALGVFGIALVALLCEFVTVLEPVFVALIIGSLYLGAVAYISIRRIAKSRIYPTKSIHGLLAEEGSVVFKNSTSPTIIFDFHGTILWYNDAMRSALNSYNNFIGEKISDVLSINAEELEDGECRTVVSGKTYSVEGFVVSKKNNGLYIAMLSDVTALDALEKKYYDERVAVAYIQYFSLFNLTVYCLYCFHQPTTD